MSLIPPNSVDPFVIGLAILDDDGVVTWVNATWRNLADSGNALAHQNASQLARAFSDADTKPLVQHAIKSKARMRNASLVGRINSIFTGCQEMCFVNTARKGVNIWMKLLLCFI